MIISPPFLPERLPQETDDAFVDRCMVGGNVGQGGYPVSFEVNWHGGLHLQATVGPGGAALPVRAIADGVVAYLRAPTPRSTSPTHPLQYHGGWTDDGCVVLRHETSIGANAGGVPTTAVFFSIYMHLGTVSHTLKKGDPIYRKTEIGAAGSIYGVSDQIHFEIVCDDANVQALTGRRDTYSTVEHDGRADAVYGVMYFFVPTGTSFLAGDPRGAAVPPAVAFSNDEATFVGQHFDQGDLVTQSLSLGGSPIGAARKDPALEYELYATASGAYPHSPSAGYELLRFGRVLGPDVLVPSNAANWRLVDSKQGSGWINLNDPTVKKFSDGDFPSWERWMLVDDTYSTDSRCRALEVRELLDINDDLNVSASEAQQALADPAVQSKLARKICKIQTEWDSSSVDARWSWLKTNPVTRMSAANYATFKQHVAALCFWQNAQLGLDPRHWHFQPREFIRQFRKCGWLSNDELTQLLPRRPGAQQGHFGSLPWATAQQRLLPYAVDLNRMFRKYNILDATRQTQFLVQARLESALWQISNAVSAHPMREFGRGHGPPWAAPAIQYYTVFYGRGIMQLTWPANYEQYGQFRQFPAMAPGAAYADARIMQHSLHYWADPRDHNGNIVGVPHVWFPRYDPEIVADNTWAACDSGGFYWVSKLINRHDHNINRVSDQPFTPASVGRISVLVNGGGYGFADRQSYAAFIARYRTDDTSATPMGHFQAHHGSAVHNIDVDYTAQRP